VFRDMEPSIGVVSMACLFAGILLGIASQGNAETAPVMTTVMGILSQISIMMMIILQWSLAMLINSRLRDQVLNSPVKPSGGKKDRSPPSKAKSKATISSIRQTQTLLIVFAFWSGTSVFFWSFTDGIGFRWASVVFAVVAVFFFSLSWKELLGILAQKSKERVDIDSATIRAMQKALWKSLLSMGVYWFMLEYRLISRAQQSSPLEQAKN